MEIQLYNKLNEPLEAIDRIGQWFCASGMFGCSKAEQGKVLALVCMTEQMTPVQVLEKYYVMSDGKLSKKAHGLLAAFLKMGGKHTWLKDGSDGVSARLRLEMKDRAPVECEYSMEDAKREQLIRKGSAWEKKPRVMMRARCETEGIAMICPEIAVDDYAESAEPVAAPLLPPIATTTSAEAPTEPKRKRKEEKALDAEVVKQACDALGGKVVSENLAQRESSTAETPNPKEPAAPLIVPSDGIQVTLGADGRVSPESIKAFVTMCQDHALHSRQQDFEQKAMRWLVDKRYIEPDKLFTIKPERLQKIFDNRDSWFQVVESAQ